MKRYIIGIDPGVSGGIAVYDYVTGSMSAQAVKKMTPVDIVEVLATIRPDVNMCYLERVHSMPRDGKVQAFKFGMNFGTYIGILSALRIPFNYVAPGVWQRVLGCLSKGDKKVTKRKAQELFPAVSNITHAIADAILIAEYGRRRNMECVTPNKGRYSEEVEDL